MIVEELKLDQVEFNKISFSNKIVDFFNKYSYVNHLSFNIDKCINSHEENGHINFFFKEAVHLNKIGFLSYKELVNLSPHHIHNILLSNSPKENLLINGYNFQLNASLFHLYFIGETILIKSHLDAYPLEQPFNICNTLLTQNLDSFFNRKDSCPSLNFYLERNNLIHLLEEAFLNNLINEIKSIERLQVEHYPLQPNNLLNPIKYNLEKINFYRNTLHENISMFFGEEMNCKIRALSLSEKLILKQKKHIKKKI